MQVKEKRKLIVEKLKTARAPTAYQVEYNMDETDREILLFIQKKYNWINEDIYELVMDRLEKEHHFLQRIAMTKISETDELSDECNICGEKETENDNFLVFCDGCNIAVHQSCYGVPNIPEGSWLCRPCLLSPRKTISCILCPSPGGAYKRTSNGFWCHVLCGLLVPRARFENMSLVEPVDIEDVHRSQHQCFECGMKKGGIVPCAYYGCCRFYHATCAVKSEKYIDMANYIIFCHDHDPLKKVDTILIRSPDANYGSLENPPAIRNPVQLWLPQRRVHSEIESVPVKISSYVVNKIVARDLNSCNDASRFVKEMFTVWQVRKKDRPIIKRLRIDSSPEGFKNWGTRAPIESEPSEINKKILKEFELPSSVILPAVDASLYSIAVLGAYKMQKTVGVVEKSMYSIRRSIANLEKNRNSLLSKFINGYTHMKLLYEDLLRTDKHELFRELVTDDIASGYSSIIQNPISLGMIDEKITKLAYKSLSDMLKDVEILIANAYKYNGEQSFIGIETKRLEEVLMYWKIREKDRVLARVLPRPYLPYTVTRVEIESAKDLIEVEDILTEEKYLVERAKVIKIERINESINRIPELNEITGISVDQEKEQTAYLKAYKHKFTDEKKQNH